MDIRKFAHDILNKLTVVYGNAHIINRAHCDHCPYARHMASIQRAAKEAIIEIEALRTENKELNGDGNANTSL